MLLRSCCSTQQRQLVVVTALVAACCCVLSTQLASVCIEPSVSATNSQAICVSGTTSLAACRSATGAAKPVDFNTLLQAGDVIVFTGDLTKLGNLVLEWNLVPDVPAGFTTAVLQQPGGHGLACEQLGAGGMRAHHRCTLLAGHVTASWQQIDTNIRCTWMWVGISIQPSG